MKRIMTCLATLMVSMVAMAQNSYQALRFRQPLAYHQYLMRQLHQQTAARDASFAEALKSKKQMQAYIADARQRLQAIVGELPERGDLKARVVGREEAEDFSVEKIVFQSAPGRYVTAHLYLPRPINGRVPACIEMCGHGVNGKGSGSLLAELMVANGIAAMVVDPLSQGERLQLIDAEGKPLTRGVTTEHTLVNPAFNLLGSSLAAQEYFDNSRAIDYLLTRSDIDGAHIGAYGFSGGGTQAAYLLALDERVQCGCVGLFFSSRERTLELVGPSDGCQQIPYEGRQRIEIADMAMMMAPRPFIVLDGKYDFVDHWGALRGFDDLQRCYAVLGCPERVRQYYAEDGHATPPDVQCELVEWFSRWLLGTTGDVRLVPFWRGEQMLCTKTGQVNMEYADAQSVSTMTQQLMDSYAPRRAAFRQLPHDSVVAVLSRYLALPATLGAVEVVPTGNNKLRGFTELRFQLNRQGQMPLPCVVRIPDNVNAHSSVQVHLCEQGKAWYLAETDRYDAVSDGTIVVAADFRGVGETADPYELNLLKYWNREYRLSASALHIGVPLLGQRVVDMLTLLDFLGQHESLKNRPVDVYADGLYGPVVMHAAVLDSRIRRAAISRSLRTWRSYLEQPMQYDMLSNVLYGVLRDYDLPDLVHLSQGRVRFLE